jgi:hypothetical protein
MRSYVTLKYCLDSWTFTTMTCDLLLTLKRRRSQFLAFGWTETEPENDWKWFLIHFLLVDLAWRVMNSIHLSLQSCKYLSSHEWEVRKKNGCIILLFQCILLLSLNLKFLLENDIFWVWAQLTKQRSPTLVSTPIGILGKFAILNILLEFELWMYFWCLLYSNYRRKRDLSSHHDACHYNVHPRWNFQIFWNDFLFDMNFSSLFFQKFS